MYANITVGISGMIAFLWLLFITLPINWIRCENLAFTLQITMYVVYLDKSGLWSAVEGAFTGGSEKLLDEPFWIGEAKDKFCSVRTFTSMLGSDWCDQWEKLYYATWSMVILGYLAALLFAIGAGCMYYYAFSHATETGRIWTKSCLTIAPFVATVGILMFSLFTMSFGNGWNLLGASVGATNRWAHGFYLCLVLGILSWIPLYVMMLFAKVDPFEKERGVDYNDEDGVEVGAPPQYRGGAPNYDGAGMGVGPGAAPQYRGGPPGMGGAPNYSQGNPGAQWHGSMPPHPPNQGPMGPHAMGFAPQNWGPPQQQFANRGAAW